MALSETQEILLRILQENKTTNPTFGELQKVELTETSSEIILKNGGQLWCFTGYGLENLFRKDRDDTFVFGRQKCDMVKDHFSCFGFFTTDELPRYGIKRRDAREIWRQMGKEKDDTNLIFIMAYDYDLSKQIRSFLIEHLQKEIAAVQSLNAPTTAQIAS
ncbi:MAG: hypothetical protein ACOCXQ_03440 [Patescibacteria group bacterium]